MDTHSDDLSELERRLAACAPSSAGLDADAMLFAAGRAAARPRAARFVWPGLTVCLAALATFLGLWLAVERSERLSLVEQLQQPATAPSTAPVTPEPATSDELEPNSVLASRKALEKGLDAWPPAPMPRTDSLAPQPADTPIFRVGRADNLPDL
jgi:hypothetical protein